MQKSLDKGFIDYLHGKEKNNHFLHRVDLRQGRAPLARQFLTSIRTILFLRVFGAVEILLQEFKEELER